MAIMELTKDNFEEETKEGTKPLLVDFWAPWCGYCRMIAPAVDKLSEEASELLRVGKINIDEQPELAERFGVMTIPTLILMRDGKAGQPLVAPQSGKKVKEWIKEQGMEI